MKIDIKIAEAKIRELEELLEDRIQAYELACEERDEWKERARVLEHDLHMLRVDRRYEVSFRDPPVSSEAS